MTRVAAAIFAAVIGVSTASAQTTAGSADKQKRPARRHRRHLSGRARKRRRTRRPSARARLLPDAGGSNSAAPTVQSGNKPLKVSPDCPPDSKPKGRFRRVGRSASDVPNISRDLVPRRQRIAGRRRTGKPLQIAVDSGPGTIESKRRHPKAVTSRRPAGCRNRRRTSRRSFPTGANDQHTRSPQARAWPLSCPQKKGAKLIPEPTEPDRRISAICACGSFVCG